MGSSYIQGVNMSTLSLANLHPPHHLLPTTPQSPDPNFHILLDSPNIVFRGLQGQEFEPATLSGRLILNLEEKTCFKEISMTFKGQANLNLPMENLTTSFNNNHSIVVPLFFHDFQFLEGIEMDSVDHHHRQVHTLNPGRHCWPFSLTLPSTLPASIKTFTNVGTVEYELKAIAKRGHFERDLKAKRSIKISRMLAEESMEFNQSLEIENTWPGKILYSITLPQKAYAAGDSIPISLKFSPVKKGVTVDSIVMSIQENCVLNHKGVYHQSRDVITTKYMFKRKSRRQLELEIGDAGQEENRSGYDAVQVDPWTKTLPKDESITERDDRVSSIISPLSSSSSSLSPSTIVNSTSRSNLDNDRTRIEEEELETKTEIDVIVHVPIPNWTTPSHNISPLMIGYKLRWSAWIKNPDGHISELRCALPIIILDFQHLEEARLASQGIRNLLFGPSGAFVRADNQPTELPAYCDHVRDRLANPEETWCSNPTSPFSTVGSSTFSETNQSSTNDETLLRYGINEPSEISSGNYISEGETECEQNLRKGISFHFPKFPLSFISRHPSTSNYSENSEENQRFRRIQDELSISVRALGLPPSRLHQPNNINISQVPSYEVATSGDITPLEMTLGLPTYHDISGSQSLSRTPQRTPQ